MPATHYVIDRRIPAFQVAREMFGRNDKPTMKLVKKIIEQTWQVEWLVDGGSHLIVNGDEFWYCPGGILDAVGPF